MKSAVPVPIPLALVLLGCSETGSVFYCLTLSPPSTRNVLVTRLCESAGSCRVISIGTKNAIAIPITLGIQRGRRTGGILCFHVYRQAGSVQQRYF